MEQNKAFSDLQMRLRKAVADLNEQETIIEAMKERLTEALGVQAFDVKWINKSLII